MLMDPGIESKVRLISAITTLLQNAPELGNAQLKVCSNLVIHWVLRFRAHVPAIGTIAMGVVGSKLPL